MGGRLVAPAARRAPHACSSMNRRLPMSTRRALDADVDAEADRSTRSTSPGNRRSRARAASRAMARATGWPKPCSAAALSRISSASASARSYDTTRVTCGVPDVRVPVLSNTTVLTRARRSRARGPLTRMPSLGGSPERGHDRGRDPDAGGGAVVGDQDRHPRIEAPREGGAQPGQGQRAPDLAIGQLLGEELDVGLLPGRGLDGPDDPAHGRVQPQPLRPDLDLAVLDLCGREDAIARVTLDRQSLARHRLLVDHRLAAHDRAVDGDLLPRR